MVVVELTNCPPEDVSDDQTSFRGAFKWFRVRRILKPCYNTCKPVPFLHLDEEVNEMVLDPRGVYAHHRRMLPSCCLLLVKDVLPFVRQLG